MDKKKQVKKEYRRRAYRARETGEFISAEEAAERAPAEVISETLERFEYVEDEQSNNAR